MEQATESVIEIALRDIDKAISMLADITTRLEGRLNMVLASSDVINDLPLSTVPQNQSPLTATLNGFSSRMLNETHRLNYIESLLEL